jgi:hypothetical protein
MSGNFGQNTPPLRGGRSAAKAVGTDVAGLHPTTTHQPSHLRCPTNAPPLT